MSTHSKIRIVTAVLVVVLSTGAASAATSWPAPQDGVFRRIQQIVQQIRRVLRPLDEPTFPKP